MAITNLTGYKWVGNENLDLSFINANNTSVVYNISCKLENARGESVISENIEFYYKSSPFNISVFKVGDVDLYLSWGGWNNNYKPSATLTFTGGSDVSNTELIAWLEANGTLEKMVVPITQLAPFLTNIANAIRTKKGTSGVINAQNFASEIASIPTGGGENPLQALVSGKGANGGAYLCYLYAGSNVDFLSNIDFSAATSMSYMFSNCSNLTTIPSIDTSNVTNMSSMFYNCGKLITVPLLNTSKVTNMNGMFNYCKVLTTVPQLDTSNATNMDNMFGSCIKLKTIDITKLANSNSFFAVSCRRLTTLIIRTMDTIPTFGSYMLSSCDHFTGVKDSTFNPDGLKDGRIYVPDDKVEELKSATGWSDFAEIIVPLSTLVE